MPSEERPHRDLRQHEIYEWIQGLERKYREIEKAFQRAKRVGADDDMANAREHMNILSRDIGRYRAELDFRRAERTTTRAPHQSRSHPDPTTGALVTWLRQMGADPSTVRIDLTWEFQGLRLFGIYSTPENKLLVFAQVPPSTPGATMLGPTPVLPANNRRELGAAIEAEKRARRR